MFAQEKFIRKIARKCKIPSIITVPLPPPPTKEGDKRISADQSSFSSFDDFPRNLVLAAKSSRSSDDIELHFLPPTIKETLNKTDSEKISLDRSSPSLPDIYPWKKFAETNAKEGWRSRRRREGGRKSIYNVFSMEFSRPVDSRVSERIDGISASEKSERESSPSHPTPPEKEKWWWWWNRSEDSSETVISPFIKFYGPTLAPPPLRERGSRFSMACDLITRNSARYSAGVEKEGRGVERGYEWYFVRGVSRGHRSVK